MKIALIHLSDIHLRTDRKNSVFNGDPAVNRVVSAVRSRLSGHDVEASFLVVTGDIAYHGLVEEYKLAARLLEQIRHGIAQAVPDVPCHLVMVPGNHDCDFRTQYPELELRSRVLKTEGLENIDPFTAKTVCCVQKPYEDFAKAMMADSRVVTETGPCVTTHDFALADGVVRFYLLNTAWMSEQSEKQGRLLIPPAGLHQPPGGPTPAVAIVLQHHPKNWLRASNSREVMRRLEGLADLILTGHEHESDDAHVTRASGAQVDYIEGHALQTDDLAGAPASAFKVIVADTLSGSQLTYDLSLSEGSLYLPDSDTPSERPLSRNPKRLEQSFTWSERGHEFAADLGIPVTHERRERVNLDDLFVYPLVREIPLGTSAAPRPGRLSAEKLALVGTSTLLMGGDLCGKTTLSRVFFSTARQKLDLVPIYLRGIDIKRPTPKDCRAAVDSAYRLYYATPIEKFRQLPKERKVLIIDDLHRSSQRGKAMDAILRWCVAEFGTLVVVADNILFLGELIAGSGRALLPTFARYEILPFGHIKRDELVRRWCAVGESPENALEVKQRAARAMHRVETIMGKRFVPNVPLFVIGILQQVEVNEESDNYTASQGAVFEALATLKLHTIFKDDLLTAKNYLAHLAFALHQGRQRFMSGSEFESWHQDYCTRHKLRLRSTDMRNRLVDAQVLQVLDDEIGFCHRFGYYLFIADYFARHMEEEATRSYVAEMFSNVFHEETANILVFLCFKAAGHTEFVVNAMLTAARTLFSEHAPARLEDDAKDLGKLLLGSDGPKLEDLSPEERRSRMLEGHETAAEQNPYGNLREDDLNHENHEESKYPPEVREVYAGIRTIQILGQILANFYGTLGGTQKVEIARATYELSMRVVGWSFGYMVSHHHELAEAILEILYKDRPRVPADMRRLEGAVRQLVASLAEAMSVAMVQRAAEATGMRALEPVFGELLTTTAGVAPSAAYRLVGLELAMNLSPKAAVGEIRATARQLRDNPFAFRILQRLALTYLNVNYVDVPMTQQICSAADIMLPPDSFDLGLKKLPRYE